MDSTEAWERRKRFVSALSSRKRPSNKCSVSIYGEPNWLASYRAKKMTRRAFSVYRSNIPCPRGQVYFFRCSCRKQAITQVTGITCESRFYDSEPFVQFFEAIPHEERCLLLLLYTVVTSHRESVEVEMEAGEECGL